MMRVGCSTKTWLSPAALHNVCHRRRINEGILLILRKPSPKFALVKTGELQLEQNSGQKSFGFGRNQKLGRAAVNQFEHFLRSSSSAPMLADC
jgi:hypothetical protein